jgi:hypothetical protein
MATKTFGTLSGSTLTAVQIPPGYNATPLISDNDWGTINNSIYNDVLTPKNALPATRPIFGGAFTKSGLLYIPNRGVLQTRPGDWVAVDPYGWPILLSDKAVPQTLTATGTTTNSSTAVTALSTNVLNLGWAAGQAITGANVPANTVIQAIAANGLSLTLSKAATGGASGTTFTVSSWTHN